MAAAKSPAPASYAGKKKTKTPFNRQQLSNPLFYLDCLWKQSSCTSHNQLYLQLLGEVVGDYGREGGEQGSQEYTDVTDVDGDVEKV